MNRALLQRLVPNTLAAATEGRQRADIGPFALFVSDASDDPIQSFAVPVAPAPDWRPAVAELQQAFDAAGRRFRVEFFRELHPALSPTLYAMGYEREMEAPLMVLHRDAYRPGSDDPARLLAAEDEAAIDGLMLVQREAFDQPLDDAGEADFRVRLRQGLTRGSRRAALARLDGVPAASGLLLIGGDTAELAAVGTRPAFRRRGLAEAVCRRLLEAYFAGDDLVWLSAAAGAEPLYAKLGFRPVGTQLNFGNPRTK
ncbi:GNAT family N-acetyltransferase [Inquilinus sp. Marseille-Q2685]|uniref:GNAT family N-acetyltransferase n=1 Tax=Inquilinus sp. Marseille-Q2685 TaxID=2866581 RepID=UPI001CE3BE7C|nr:GNAT family N-acetyltransferase [Inquilinus sp. Marseille-Q2685]